jgi:hypothetical protein
MSSSLKYTALCLASLVPACDDDGSDFAAPGPSEVPAAAAVQTALVAPAIGLSAYRLYYCYAPGGNRTCVALKRQLRVTSTGIALRWTSASQNPWIVVSPSGGTTPTSVTVSVDPRKLAAFSAARGSFTIAAAGASNSPQRVSVVVNATGRGPLVPPALAFSDSAIGFCFMPSSTRACVRLEEQVRFTSVGGTPLTWRAVSSAPWIVIHPAGGTTPTDVRVFVDYDKLPPRSGTTTSVSGSITVSATGASNSPQTIPVKLQFYSQPLPQ